MRRNIRYEKHGLVGDLHCRFRTTVVLRNKAVNDNLSRTISQYSVSRFFLCKLNHKENIYHQKCAKYGNDKLNYPNDTKYCRLQKNSCQRLAHSRRSLFRNL